MVVLSFFFEMFALRFQFVVGMFVLGLVRCCHVCFEVSVGFGHVCFEVLVGCWHVLFEVLVSRR